MGQYNKTLFLQSSATADTYYTALDITAAGNLQIVNIVSNNQTNDKFKIKFTVDGTETEIGTATLTRVHSFAPTDGTPNGQYAMLFKSKIKFSTSLKVEVKLTAVATSDIHCAIEYQLD